MNLWTKYGHPIKCVIQFIFQLGDRIRYLGKNLHIFYTLRDNKI